MVTNYLLFVVDAPGIAKRLDVHVAFIVLALLVSTATAISNIVLGQQLRGALFLNLYYCLLTLSYQLSLLSFQTHALKNSI